ncbi:MAG TPA: acetyl-CoA C-acyltransferase, partial [Burkholderiaceae bacterium]
MNDPVVIVGAARTPMGAFQGDFANVTASDLGAVAIKAAVERAGVPADSVEHVFFGNCLMAGQGQAPARQALLKAGLPVSTGAVTLSKMCGSAMQATMFAVDNLLAGSSDIVVAGGMESMTNAPYLIPKARGGYRIGHGMMFDHMMYDGLEDAYSREPNGGGRSMGTFAEECVAKYQFTREEQDHFAIESVKRAQAATNNGDFKWEVAPVTVSSRAGDTVIEKDEGPLRAKLDKIPALKAAFKKDGTITAASSSSINDGAAALVLMRESTAKKLGVTPLARIVGHATHAREPNWFTTAPIGAIENLYKKTGWTTKDVDLFEINEAFAAVPMAAMKDLGI